MDWYPLERGVHRRRGPRVLAALAVLLIAAVPAAMTLRSAPSTPAVAPSNAVSGAAAAADPRERSADESDTTDEAVEPVEPVEPVEDIAQIARQVAEIRMLDLRRPVDATFLPSPELIARLTELTADEEGASAPLDSRVRLLATLRMLPAQADVASSLQIVYDDSLVGLYVPAERRLYVVEETEEQSPRTRWTSAHEIVHALQDQTFDLGPLLEHPPGAVDAELAALALLEGDAVLTQELWSIRFQTALERSRLGDGLGGGLIPLPGRVPRFVSAQFAFPYEAGTDFVVALFEHGGFAAVDAAMRNPPRTTAEIFDPDRYLAGFTPIETTVSSEPGEGWEQARTDEMGAFHLRQMLDQLGATAAERFATGWTGGSVRSWHRDDDTAVAGVIVFETEEGAAALCEVLPRWWQLVAGGQPVADGSAGGPQGWLAASCEGPQVRFGVAPDVETARRLTG
jgi:hypothetical protein